MFGITTSSAKCLPTSYKKRNEPTLRAQDMPLNAVYYRRVASAKLARPFTEKYKTKNASNSAILFPKTRSTHSVVKPNQAEPSQAKPSQAKPGYKLSHRLRRHASDTKRRSVLVPPMQSKSQPSQAKPNQPKLSHATPNPAKGSKAKPSQATPNQAMPSLTQIRQARPSEAKPSQAKPSQVKPRQAKPR